MNRSSVRNFVTENTHRMRARSRRIGNKKKIVTQKHENKIRRGEGRAIRAASTRAKTAATLFPLDTRTRLRRVRMRARYLKFGPGRSRRSANCARSVSVLRVMRYRNFVSYENEIFAGAPRIDSSRIILFRVDEASCAGWSARGRGWGWREETVP